MPRRSLTRIQLGGEIFPLTFPLIELAGDFSKSSGDPKKVGHHGIATVNGDDGFLVITQPDGTQVFTKLLDSTGTPPGSGALFGLVFASEGLFFVDDATNTLNVLR